MKIDGLEAEFTMDADGNMKADAKMWRFLVRDKQVTLKDDVYQPIISSDFQNIIGNKQIEEICSSLDAITNYEQRIERMRELLKEQKLSQLHFFLDLNKNEDTNIVFTFSEFHIILAAQTVASLSKTLEQVNHIQNHLLPQLVANKPQAAKEEEPVKIEPVKAEKKKSNLSADKVLGTETKLTFRGELSNIVFMLPKSGLKNKEKVAKFSLTTKVDVDMVKTEMSSSMNVNARIEEICLDIIKNDTVLVSLIEKTRVVFEMEDNSVEETKLQTRRIKAYVDPIKIHIAFSHLGFFANTAAGILANLPSLEKASRPKSIHRHSTRQERPVEKPAAKEYRVRTAVDGGIKLVEFIVFDDSEESRQKYPWIQLNLTSAGAALETEDFQGKQTMKGKTGIEAFKGRICKKVVESEFRRFVKNFKKEHDESTFPYMPVLEFGFEDLEASMARSVEENMDLDAHLHRLYLKDVELISRVTETDSQIVPAIAPAFQDIISNPLVEASKSNLHQLEVKLNMNKQSEETVVKLTYSDFRVIISPPLVTSMLDIMDLFNTQMAKITEKLQVKGQQPQQEVEVVKAAPAAVMPTKRLHFTGDITNIEIWVPRSVESNQNRICQFSLTTRISFSLVEKSEADKLLTRTMTASIKVYHLAFVMINKHLIAPDEPVSKASIEPIMLPSRISIDFRQHEDTAKDTQKRNVEAYIEPISITVGFREIAFFKALQVYYQTELINKLPQDNKKEQPKVDQEIESVEDAPFQQKAGYNKSTMNVELRMDPLNFILSDDTGIIEQHLFKLLISTMKMELTMASFVNELERDKDSDHLLCVGNFLMEALYYNSTVADYEPVIESWGLGWEVLQHSPDRGKEITVQADKMLNLNLSYAGSLTSNLIVGNAIGVALKKVNELEENWLKEQEEEKETEAETVDSISQTHRETEGFIFENRLGRALTFYVQTMSGETVPESSYHQFTLEPDKLLFLSRLELKHIRKEQSKSKYGQPLKLISEDMLRIMVRLKEWKFTPDIPIELGGCHSFVFAYKNLPSSTRYKEATFPALCRVGNTVIISSSGRNITRW